MSNLYNARPSKDKGNRVPDVVFQAGVSPEARDATVFIIWLLNMFLAGIVIGGLVYLLAKLAGLI